MNTPTNMKALFEHWLAPISFEIMGRHIVLPVVSTTATALGSATVAIFARTYPPVAQWLDADAHLSHAGALGHDCAIGAVVGILALIVLASLKKELREAHAKNRELEARNAFLRNEVEQTDKDFEKANSKRRQLERERGENQAAAEAASASTQPPPSRKSKRSKCGIKPASASAASAV